MDKETDQHKYRIFISFCFNVLVCADKHFYVLFDMQTANMVLRYNSLAWNSFCVCHRKSLKLSVCKFFIDSFVRDTRFAHWIHTNLLQKQLSSFEAWISNFMPKLRKTDKKGNRYYCFHEVKMRPLKKISLFSEIALNICVTTTKPHFSCIVCS